MHQMHPRGTGLSSRSWWWLPSDPVLWVTSSWLWTEKKQPVLDKPDQARPDQTRACKQCQLLYVRAVHSVIHVSEVVKALPCELTRRLSRHGTL